jgi:hypothetical protein
VFHWWDWWLLEGQRGGAAGVGGKGMVREEAADNHQPAAYWDGWVRSVCIHGQWVWSVEHMCNKREQRNSFPLILWVFLRAAVREWNVLVGCINKDFFQLMGINKNVWWG